MARKAMDIMTDDPGKLRELIERVSEITGDIDFDLTAEVVIALREGHCVTVVKHDANTRELFVT